MHHAGDFVSAYSRCWNRARQVGGERARLDERTITQAHVLARITDATVPLPAIERRLIYETDDENGHECSPPAAQLLACYRLTGKKP